MSSQHTISVPSTPVSHSGVTTPTSASTLNGTRQFSTQKQDPSEKQSEFDLEKGAAEEGAKSNAEGGAKKPGKLRMMLQQYGRIAIVAYLAVSTIDLACCVWAVWLGGDSLVFTINSYLGQYIPRLQKAAQRMEEGGDGGSDKWVTIFIVGYAVHKCLTPLRAAITAAILPWSARQAQRLGWTWLIPKGTPAGKTAVRSAAETLNSRKLK
ncbi:DUF1279 super [Linderina macrospora]|uniref:DUF1279 super n=1 Tax=Linderina macrospora TaxID=4868 RepID=A0ACC1J9H9_9FUNG|nr:DUF1279 super [Linderina macrospora]